MTSQLKLVGQISSSWYSTIKLSNQIPYLDKTGSYLVWIQICSVNRTAHIRHQWRKTTVLSCHRCLINTGVEKNGLCLNINQNFDHPMSLSKSKCWYSNNCLHFVKCTQFHCQCRITFLSHLNLKMKLKLKNSNIAVTYCKLFSTWGNYYKTPYFRFMISQSVCRCQSLPPQSNILNTRMCEESRKGLHLGSSLVCKYQTNVELTDSDKHSSLL